MPDLRTALEDLVSAFDVDEGSAAVTVKPDRVLIVALRHARDALADAAEAGSALVASLRWSHADELGVADLIDLEDRVWGYTMPLPGGTIRGYAIVPPRTPYSTKLSRVTGFDHPDETTARAWVKAEVAKRGGGTDALSTFGGEG